MLGIARRRKYCPPLLWLAVAPPIEPEAVMARDPRYFTCSPLPFLPCAGSRSPVAVSGTQGRRTRPLRALGQARGESPAAWAQERRKGRLVSGVTHCINLMTTQGQPGQHFRTRPGMWTPPLPRQGGNCEPGSGGGGEPPGGREAARGCRAGATPPEAAASSWACGPGPGPLLRSWCSGAPGGGGGAPGPRPPPPPPAGRRAL